MLKLTAVALMLLAAAPKGKPAPAPEAPPDPCGADKLKLGDDVKKLSIVELPTDCKPKPPAIRVIVRSEKEVPSRVTCKVTGVDWKKQMLIVMTKSVTPGTTTDIWDDRGKKVTLVSRQKGVCPNAPKAGDPQTVTIAFAMDQDPVPPEFGEASCFMPVECK
jgi:hypothetical protein